MINGVRKNIGAIVASIGLVLLAIVTFGDIGEIFTEKYWEHVGNNFTALGAVTVGLVFVQVAIKQGISEQALSKGLNTEETRLKFAEHKNILTKNQSKRIYLPFFLRLRNDRETKRRRQEFLTDNEFLSEAQLLRDPKSNKKLIKKYYRISENITVPSIKWATTEIKYNKKGRIETLETYRRTRAIKGTIMGLFSMLGTTLIASGLFGSLNPIPFWQKVVQLLTYILVISVTSLFDISKNYEKGAFSVPNELDELNSIWKEFEEWEVPEWVKKEFESKEVIKDEKRLLEYTTRKDI